jgi:DNA-binding CsgD family transcriptional regulator
MLNWTEIVQESIIKNSNRIRATTEPIRRLFGVNYFTYHQIDQNGSYKVLLDRPDWAEYYVSEKFYLIDPYLRHPDAYQSGFFLLEQHGTDAYKERIFQAGEEFDLNQNVIYIEKSPDKVEFFGFSGHQKSSSLDQLYLNHPWTLKSFAAHFKQEMVTILQSMEGSPLTLLKGGDFHSREPIPPGKISDALETYLREIGQGKMLDLAKSLSKRERECIQLLGEGKTAKEIAILLSLSHRTVESYLENIKNKLSCNNKQELFSLASEFQELGLLP